MLLTRSLLSLLAVLGCLSVYANGGGELSTFNQQSSTATVIVDENFAAFTYGSQSNPYGPLDNNGAIPSKYHPSTPALGGVGVYSIGGYAMLYGSGCCFTIDEIAPSLPLDYEIKVCALTRGASVTVELVDIVTEEVVLAIDPVELTYDGYFSTLTKNGLEVPAQQTRMKITISEGAMVAFSHIYVAQSTDAGVDLPLTDDINVEPVYYDITGREAANPTKGQLYLRKRGSVVDKVVIK